MHIYLVFFTVLLNINPESGPQSCAEVKTNDGVPALFIDDEPYPPFAYMSYLGEKKYYQEVAERDIHIYNIPAYLGDRGINSASGIGPFRPPVWVGENRYDFSSIAKDFDEILAADPQAKVIVRFHLDPPLWWENKNLDSAARLPDGTVFRHSFSSEKWREEAGEALRSSIEWLSDSDYTEYLIGIHVAGGYTEEWFYHFRDTFYDESPVRTEAFRRWLRHEYNNDITKLQSAWNNKAITFSTAETADISGEIRRDEWRNPVTEQNYIDTYRFHAETMVDNIIYFTQIVKEASNDCLLTGAFYGYHYFVTDARRGHGALAKLLEYPGLDYLSSPNVYHRVAGEDWAPMAAIKSVQMHGKLWLAENDTRTSETTLLRDRAPEINPEGGWYDGGVWLGPKDPETSVALLWKNAGRMLTHGYGGWWFDMWGGWFSHPLLLSVLEKTQQFFVEFPPEEEEKMEAEVGVIVDEEIGFRDTSFGKLSGKILSNRYPLGKTGAPHDLFLRSDLDSVITRDYKIIWLMGLPELKDEERNELEKWLKQGTMVLWTHTNGTKIYNNSEEEIDMYEKFEWSASELRELWKKAGVHIYLDTDDVLYAGRKWLTLHTTVGGKKVIEFPFYAQVVDPLTKEVLSDSTKSLELKLDSISTKLLVVSPLE